jgi:hypothetical protein
MTMSCGEEFAESMKILSYYFITIFYYYCCYFYFFITIIIVTVIIIIVTVIIIIIIDDHIHHYYYSYLLLFLLPTRWHLAYTLIKNPVLICERYQEKDDVVQKPRFRFIHNKMAAAQAFATDLMNKVDFSHGSKMAELTSASRSSSSDPAAVVNNVELIQGSPSSGGPSVAQRRDITIASNRCQCG